MAFNIDDTQIPKFQTLGMIGVVLLFFLTILVFSLSSSYFSDDDRLNQLHAELIAKEKDRLRSEVASAQDYIRFMSEQADKVLRVKSKEEVDKAYTIADDIYSELSGSLPDNKIKSLIVESLRDIRFFNGRGYIFIDDMQGLCVLLPTAEHLEGASLWDNQDDTGHFIMQGLIQAVQNPDKAGYSRYRWYAPGDTSRMRNKIAYVRYFEPFDWVIGTGDYLFETENDLKQTTLDRLSSLRFGKNGYISVLDKFGNVLYTPNSRAPKLPVHYSRLDEEEQSVIKTILDKSEQGGGFIEYEWYLPDSSKTIAEKISLVSNVPGWDWVLVAGAYPETIDQVFADQAQKLRAELKQDLTRMLVALASLSLILMVVAWVYGRWLRKLFIRYKQNLRSQQEQIAGDAKALGIAAKVFESAHEGIMVTDAGNRIVAINDSFTAITGYQSEDVIGKSPSLLSSGKHSEGFYQRMWQALNDSGHWTGEVWNRCKSGELYAEQLSITTDKNKEGEIQHYIATFNDISEQKRAEKQLRYMAEYDELSGLPNRRLLMDRVEQTIARAKRGELESFSLIFMDLDRFKNINDSLGHSVGDLVLQEISRRLLSAVREVDTVSRIGGDEFVILISDHHEDSLISAANLAQRLLRLIADPIIDGDHQLIITPSIGIASYPDDADSFSTLLRNADAALYHAKSQGRNNYQFYSREMNEKASIRLRLEHDIRVAIDRKEFELFYQPQFDATGVTVTGCEALIRWKKDGCFIPPDEFISLCEETGLILPLGEWVIEEGCRQGAEWLESGYNLPSLAVNVSPVQFGVELFDVIQMALKNSGFPAEKLVLEITESALVKNVEQTEDLLRMFRTLGVKLALDDFGTGYSSLAYLKRFPVDKLKIDRAFIDGLPNDEDDKAITASILDVAHHLGLETIAEGVETEEQLYFLQAYNCDQVQGFLLSKPVPANELVRYLPRTED